MVVKPLGTFSLSGGQLKFSANTVPVLRCLGCGLELVGHYEDGNAVFDPKEDHDYPHAG